MKTILRLAILFVPILLVFIISIAAARSNNPDTWLLLHNRNTGELSALNPETETYATLGATPENEIRMQWISPNGVWFYYYAVRNTVRSLWAYNLLTENLREIVPCIETCPDLAKYLSAGGEMMFLFDDTSFRRLDSNRALFVEIEVDMPAFNDAFSWPWRHLEWLNNENGFRVSWHNGYTYRISYDGKTVEPFDGPYRHTSPDGKWAWYSNMGKVYIENIAGAIRQIPRIDDTGIRLGWTSDNVLIVRYYSERLLDIDLTTQNGPAYVPQFERLNGSQWVYVHTLSGWTYRISRDGTMVELYNVLQTTLSPDGNWGWYQEGGEYFVKNLVDGSVFNVPGMDAYSGRVSGWTPDSSLIVQYIGDDRYIDFHNSRQPATSSVAKFQDGSWTVVSEDKITFHESSGQAGAVSPAHTHYVYFEDVNVLTIMDLRTEAVTPIGEASQFYHWNTTGDWLVYIRPENKSRLTVLSYDVNAGSNKPLYTFDWNGSSFGFQTIAGTDLLVLYWLGVGAAGDLLMDVRTGQIRELQSDVDVISKWNSPAFPAPRYGLHVVVGVVLLSVSRVSAVMKRRRG